jgi:hypothetical protein
VLLPIKGRHCLGCQKERRFIPLFEAAENGHLDVVAYLVVYGADLQIKTENVRLRLLLRFDSVQRL